MYSMIYVCSPRFLPFAFSWIVTVDAEDRRPFAWFGDDPVRVYVELAKIFSCPRQPFVNSKPKKHFVDRATSANQTSAENFLSVAEA